MLIVVVFIKWVGGRRLGAVALLAGGLEKCTRRSMGGSGVDR